MEFTPSPSSIFQNKKIKYNNKKPTKNGIIWINFSKIRKACCTLTPLSLRSARLTQYIWLAPAVARPIFASVSLRQTSDILKRCATYIFYLFYD